MYKVVFETKMMDKKIVKVLKNIKTKHGHSLVEAQQVLKDIQNVVSGSTKVAYKIVDIENELEYVFEDIIVKENANIPDLMFILEDEIISSGHENAQKILNEIENQYQAENVLNSDDSGKDDEQTNDIKPKGKGFSFLSKIKKNKIKKQTNKSVDDVDEDDFAELEKSEMESLENVDSNEIISSHEEPNTDDLSSSYDLSNQDIESEVEESELVKKEESETVEEVLVGTYKFDSSEDVAELEEVSLDTEEETLIEDSFSENIEDEDHNEMLNTNVSYGKKHENVVFPEYDKYLSLATLENTIKRQKERFEKDRLVKLLGLNSLGSNSDQTELDTIKLNFALNSLSESNFVLITDYLYNAIEDIIDKTQTKLAQTYGQAMGLNYEDLATNEVSPNIDKLFNETEQIFNKFKEEQNLENQIKVDKFDYEQEKALEEFKKQQKLERASYIQDVEAKNTARIGLYKDNMQTELNSKKEEIVDEKMYELKNRSVTQMAETKRQAIRNFEDQLDVAVEDIWENMKKAIVELEKEINTHIPEWKKEVDENRKIKYAEREAKRKEEELNLKKQELEIQRQKLEKDKEQNNQEESNTIAMLIENKFSEYDEKLDDHLSNNKNDSSISHNSNDVQQNNGKDSSKLTNILLASTSAILLALGGIYIGNNISADTSNETVQAVEPTKYDDQISLLVSQLEKTLNDPEELPTENLETLDSLLLEKQYEKAMSLFKDQDSLNKIEETLYSNRDLATLITFNKSFETKYGDLDEAILSNDSEQVTEQYKGLAEDVKSNLSSERKSDIALHLFQKGEQELASNLLGLDN